MRASKGKQESYKRLHNQLWDSHMTNNDLMAYAAAVSYVAM
jgi:L-rhamnose mutarotase